MSESFVLCQKCGEKIFGEIYGLYSLTVLCGLCMNDIYDAEELNEEKEEVHRFMERED